MTTLHVCFADSPQYGNEAAAAQQHHKPNTAMNETGALGELDGVIGKAETAATTTLTLQTDFNKGTTPPCKQSPGASSAHSISPTPRYERNMSFFQQLSRRFGLMRFNDDPIFNAAAATATADDDSTDSCSSMQHSTGATNTSSMCTSSMEQSDNNNCYNNTSRYLQSHGIAANMKDGHGSSSEHLSYASSETSSTVDIDETPNEQQQQSRTHSPTASAAAAKTAMNQERRSSAHSSFSRLHRRSTSSLRRAFETFSLSSRSLSCGGNTPPPQSSSCSASSNSSGTTTQQHMRGMGVHGSSTPIKSSLKYSSNIELNRKSLLGSVSVSGSTTSSKSSKSKTKPPPQRILRQPVSYTYLKGISGLPTQRVPRSAVCCQYARR